MKIINKEKGMTLVALIITIITLLILAVVTIKTVQGDKIITYAQDAKENYIKAEGEEKGIIIKYQGKLENVPKKYTIVVGDINMDGTINILDNIQIKEYLVGNYSSKYFPEIGDLDGDGDVDSTDKQLLTNYELSGKIPEEAINLMKTITLYR